MGIIDHVLRKQSTGETKPKSLRGKTYKERKDKEKKTREKLKEKIRMPLNIKHKNTKTIHGWAFKRQNKTENTFKPRP